VKSRCFNSYPFVKFSQGKNKAASGAGITAADRLKYDVSRIIFLGRVGMRPQGLFHTVMTTKKKTKSVRTSRSRKRHLCTIHGRPIRPSRWRSGHRTTGCADCYRTRKIPPPKKRLCKEHKRPILRQRWWSGYRTKGCVLCFEMPPPEERLCRKHDRPIQPSAWVRGRHSTGCCVCFKSRPGYAAAQARYRARLRLLSVRRRKHLKQRRQSKK